MKRKFIILGSVVAGLYLVFLILPLILSPILNSYAPQIEGMIKDASGYDVKLEKLGIVTTPKLTAGIKAGHAEFSIPAGEPFLTADKFSVKLSLLPLLIGRIEVDDVSLNNITTNLKVRQDGHFLIEEYLPQPDPDKPSEAVQPMPMGIKLSNHLPDIHVKEYDLTFVDMPTSKKYSLTGKNLKISDFILDKKIKFAGKGALNLDELQQFTYDVKVFNKLMPDLSLNDMVFNPEPQEENGQQNNVYFNVIDLFKALRKTELSVDLKTDIKTSGTFESPIIDGFAYVEKMSMLVDGKKLPESFIKMKANGHNISLDMDLYSAANEATTLDGKFKTGKKPNVDMKFVSNAQFNNLFRIINSLAKSFNYNDLETLSATGGLDADFSIKSNMKKVTSDGYLKIPAASVNYDLYNIAIKNIKADVDFNNMLNIKNIGLEILGQPLKIYGTVQNNSDTDIHVTADKLLLKGLVAAAGQVQLLKENAFNSGTLSLDASLKGKLSKLIPAVNLSVDNLDVKNIPSNTRVTMPEAKFVINTDGKKFNGNLSTNSLRVVNPMAVVSVPETEIIIGEKDIDIQKAYLLLNNSRIDITGKIANYINDKLNIDLKANGSILANDVKSMIPKEMRYMVSGTGKMPLNIAVTGNAKTQDIAFKLTANPSNYVSIIDVDALRGRSTIINSNIKISDDSAKLSNTGIFADNLNNAVAKLDGSVNNLSKSQNLNMRLSVPKRVNMVIPGFKNSNLAVRGDIDITGTAANPYLKGLVSVPTVTIPDMALTVTNLVANLNGPVLKGNGTIQTLKSGGIVAENLASEFSLKNYSVFYLNNLLGDAFNGKISGNISYGINDGKITVNMTGSDMNAVKAIEGAAGIPNALSGTLGFNANVVTRGATDVEMMKYLTGKVTFDINNGKFLNVGRFDNLLYAQNILGNAILKTAVTSVTSLPIIQNTAEFKTINGAMTFADGWAKINPIKTSGPTMAYYITGKYNLLNGTTNVIVLGRLDAKVVAVLGPLGDLSVDKLTAYIPKFGALTGNLINAMTSDPAKENTANIPALSSGSTNYKDFKVEFNGGLESTSSVKSFKWLSKCDTSAIDVKQEFSQAAENLKNSVQDAKQNFQDKKQQILDAKDELKNLFKF